jgi:hypothetical protein
LSYDTVFLMPDHVPLFDVQFLPIIVIIISLKFPRDIGNI